MVHDATERGAPRAPRLPYRAGIDGLRGLAVAAVVLYHAEVSWLPAGFLGVDVFFVVSGYLITALLLAEWQRDRAVDLARFWRRRARRLLPAVVVLLVGAGAATLLTAHDAAARFRGDAIAALAYVSNWWQVVGDQSYFESVGRPPVLQHLWSLAIEEQFYVVAPIVLLVALRLGVRRRGIVAGALAAAAGSTALMWLLHEPGTDPSRIYFGTDTRAAGLLVGVALAAAWSPGRLQRHVTTGARRMLDSAAAAGLVALVALMARLDEFGNGLYRGGFLAASLAAAVVVAVVAHPSSRTGRLLGLRPLRWMGTRSYALYLWHWPVFVLTRSRLDVPLSGASLFLLRLLLTAALAEASFRLVERPFREGTVGRRWLARPARVRLRVATSGLAAFALMITGLAVARGPSGPTSLAGVAAAGPAVIALPADPLAVSPRFVPTVSRRPTTTTTPPVPAQEGGVVLAVGDSVMLSAQAALVQALGAGATVDSVVARQVPEGLEVVERWAGEGRLAAASALVVHLGNNGPMASGDLDRLLAAARTVPRVVLVNVRVPRRWEGETNAALAAVAGRPGVRIVDWYAAAGAAGVLGSDGVHPTVPGAETYAALVTAQVRDG